MIDESIKDYLSKNVKSITSDELTLLFDDNIENFENSNKTEIVSSLKRIEILDPACGSGAFPMGALQRIVHLIQKCGGVSSEESALYSLKLELIEKCLYGVDIQPIAVQICKLRFFISLICEQEKTDSVEDNYGFNPLPNLETKFVAANTLIGKKKKGEPSLFDNSEIDGIKSDLQINRHKHFNAKTAESKARYRKEDMILRQKLADLLAKDSMYTQEDARQLASWNPYDQNGQSCFFDSGWMFGIKDGFDIVIGNPPYIQLQKSSGKLANLYESQNFKTYAKTGDVYCLFYEKGCSLLNDSGRLCFITSNKWMRAGYGEKLRDFFAKNTNPKLLIDFAGVRVFESATVDTNILLFEKSNNVGKTMACVAKNLTKNDLNNLSLFVQQNGTECDFTSSASWVILNPIEQSIKQKIEKIGIPLKDWDINIYRGILTGFNDAFIISEEKRKEILANCLDEDEKKRTDELIRPILRGRDIRRYGYEWGGLYLINSHNGVKEKGIPRIDVEKDYPAIKKHLDEYWDKIEKRSDKGDTPYNLRNCAYMEEFNKPKIVYPDIMRLPKDKLKMGQYPYFYFDEKGFFPEATLFIMTGENLYTIFNFLCSDIGFFIFTKYYMGPVFDNTGFRYKKEYLQELPVPILHNVTTFEDYQSKLEMCLKLSKEESDYIKQYKISLLQ